MGVNSGLEIKKDSLTVEVFLILGKLRKLIHSSIRILRVCSPSWMLLTSSCVCVSEDLSLLKKNSDAPLDLKGCASSAQISTKERLLTRRS